MKNIIYIIFGLLILASCGGSHDHDGHDHEHGEEEITTGSENNSEDDHGEGDHMKEVHLNAAQFKNAEIDTGWFSMKNINDVVNANGYTKLDPEDEADVNVPISGTIKSVSVIEGNYVKRGQTLATMSSLEYNAMLLEKAKLEEELGIDQGELVYLEQEFERQQTLATENINAQKVFQKVSADLNTAKSKIKSVKNQINILSESIDLIGSGSSSRINISAPISGYITDVNVKMGSITQPGSPLFSIVDNSKMHVDMLVYEKDLSKIKEGQKVRFILTNQSNQEIKGEIYNIGKSFANDTKSVAVHADIESNDANLIPGMYINALIDIGNETVATLPEGAIVLAEGRNFIFIYEGEENNEIHFKRVEVKVGANQLGYVEVTPLQEIEEGMKLVTNGAYYLQSHLQKSEGGGGHSH
ncbi:efflux RND transporter periplasmic adaptor subunit [Portibacter lacus]|uniref:Hemolysin D n=1 Tax=Portibacter lacus TaxID=1099794 RepID=A0AA37WG26_9BACT|nr:efflux RND transporter periplasmic adaptor subunit [Portibacter lacus]GLR17565.1 hemolysin D [Portibacter lacus]